MTWSDKNQCYRLTIHVKLVHLLLHISDSVSFITIASKIRKWPKFLFECCNLSSNWLNLTDYKVCQTSSHIAVVGSARLIKQWDQQFL